ncbi:MAG: S-adenosylmethionine decarboxylase [Candidatus Pacebacteria bacterium]|nr:S-adenosylmethionine decarboxylase [Candidatus Paceibacterota bacterium]
MEKICNFGEHLTIDGYYGNFEKLNDEKLVKFCLNELPDRVGMHKLADPEVYFAPENLNNKDSGGWSGFVVITESHISIHTFPYRGFVSIDVYTCKNGMDIDFISNYFVDKFELKDIETNFIKRGMKYPIENINN